MTTPFLETPRFPEQISYWMTGGPRYNTYVVGALGGFEKRNINWSSSRAKYNLSEGLLAMQNSGLLTQQVVSTVIAYFRAVKGMAYGFRLKDWTDFTADNTTGRLGTSGLGTGTATYQLYKHYTAGALSDDRPIKKPVAGVIVYKNGTPVTYGSGAGQITLDTTTGIVTFVSPFPTGSDALTWKGEFDVPVRFGSDELQIGMSDGGLYTWSTIGVEELRI